MLFTQTQRETFSVSSTINLTSFKEFQMDTEVCFSFAYIINFLVFS